MNQLLSMMLLALPLVSSFSPRPQCTDPAKPLLRFIVTEVGVSEECVAACPSNEYLDAQMSSCNDYKAVDCSYVNANWKLLTNDSTIPEKSNCCHDGVICDDEKAWDANVTAINWSYLTSFKSPSPPKTFEYLKHLKHL